LKELEKELGKGIIQKYWIFRTNGEGMMEDMFQEIMIFVIFDDGTVDVLDIEVC